MNSQSFCNSPRFSLVSALRSKPNAAARIKGSAEYPNISGIVRFYQTGAGVIVYAMIKNLPDTGNSIFGFHIHEGEECTGNEKDAFANAGSHYNPQHTEHPFHAGDLPPLFSDDGMAVSAFLINRFRVKEVIGRTMIIHLHPDDLMTQPSGNSGTKIACGVIAKYAAC